ncbi:lipopolysaccharide assembly protein LapB [Lacihabitans sp. CS3-21]|uniref:tetratricopeptide repeat protein n=1 Tax=Lacihabitans sp. CS3-21 TaxID=2487332 RepID=UPI0020CD643D|nr:tetratricopeptide repeat protein [Lacihabitans sp. CS3-21]MCP9746982.1 DUF2971 domain-containing protein [Lacihabitans sp. CS3-21]
MEEKSRLISEIERLEFKPDLDGIVKLLTDDILEKFSDDELYSKKIETLIKLERFDEAEKLALNANLKYPENSLFFGYLGDIYLRKEKFDKSKFFFEGALNLKPTDIHSLNGLGLFYWKQHNYVQAEDCWLRANDLDEDNFLSLHALANVYGVQGKYEKAKEYFFKAKNIQPNNPNVLSGIGNVYFNLFDFENAKDYYINALKYDENNFYSFIGLGNICLEKKEYENAKEYFNNALKVNNKVAAPFYNLGIALMGMKEYKEASLKFENALEIVEIKDLTLIKQINSKIAEVKKIISNEVYERINSLIIQIRDILVFRGKSVSHYTSLSVLQFLVLHKKPFRLSEGSFLNDSSEGQVLFAYLNRKTQSQKKGNKHSDTFGKKPFIGSFVNETNDNDLPLWRMYGKEEAQEAKGCSIRINVVEFKRCIDELIRQKNIIKSNDFESNSKIGANEGIEFYSVCYVDEDDFDFAESTAESKKELNQIMSELRNEMEALSLSKEIVESEDLEIEELLNQINFLFKSTIYKYENEVRLVVNSTINFDIMLEINSENIRPSKNPIKVFIESVPLAPLIKTITIGPKVEKAEEWAATFYYSLNNQGNSNAEISISTLPFK